MRDLFESIFANEPRDPIQAARRGLRPQLPRRFYERADVEAAEEEFRVLLDGRPVKSPARRMLAAPSRELAQRLAAEWDAQRDVIDPAKMPLTRLANSIIDGVIDSPSLVRLDVERYLACDLVFYRAPGPAGLVTRQGHAWDPVLAWARETLGAFRAGGGDRLRRAARASARCGEFRHFPTPVASGRAAFDYDAHRLGADGDRLGGRRVVGGCRLVGGACRRGLEYGVLEPR